MSTLTAEQRQEIERQGHVHIEGGAYVVLKSEVYDRLRSAWETSPSSIEEQKAVLAHVGKKAGLDDPAFDVYDDLDPRRHPRNVVMW
jgi:hypothetical protein